MKAGNYAKCKTLIFSHVYIFANLLKMAISCGLKFAFFDFIASMLHNKNNFQVVYIFADI